MGGRLIERGLSFQINGFILTLRDNTVKEDMKMSEVAKMPNVDLVYMETPKFTVTDDRKAEWCMQKIREAKADKEYWKAFYDAQYKSVAETADATISQMEALLEDYFKTVPHKKTATQENYALPSGKLVIKKQEPEFERRDDEIIEWLKANGRTDLVKVSETLNWAGLKKATTVVGENIADENGEIIPGVTVIQRPAAFKVEVK